MTGGEVGPVRPVVPQDLAAAATRVVLGSAAALLALRPWESPILSLGLAAAIVTVAYLELRDSSSKASREWVADVAEVPLVPAVAIPAAKATRVGLALGGLGGLALLAVAALLVVTSASPGYLLAPAGIVVGRSLTRLGNTRAVRRWERERDVVLCRRPSTQRFVLLHETDVERMVVVPALRGS